MRLSTKGHDPHEMGKGEGDFPAPGKYHVLVKSVDDSFTKKKTSIPVELEVIAGTVPDQRGKTSREFFYYDPADVKDFAVERLSRFLWACGLLAENDEVDIEVREAIGCQPIIELFEDTYEKDGKKKTSVKINWQDGGCWPLGDSQVADVSIDAEAAKSRKTRHGFGGPTTAPQQTQQQPQEQQPQQTAAAASAPAGDVFQGI